jgi:hypothetical protein
MDQVCQDKIGRLGGVAGSVVLYVMFFFPTCIICFVSRPLPR